jgi:hypothetical protein
MGQGSPRPAHEYVSVLRLHRGGGDVAGLSEAQSLVEKGGGAGGDDDDVAVVVHGDFLLGKLRFQMRIARLSHPFSQRQAFYAILNLCFAE